MRHVLDFLVNRKLESVKRDGDGDGNGEFLHWQASKIRKSRGWV